MSIVEYQGHAYFFLTLLMVLALYGYIYHLYKNKKSSDNIDYEEYGKMALNDELGDTPVSARSHKNKK